MPDGNMTRTPVFPRKVVEMPVASLSDKPVKFMLPSIRAALSARRESDGDQQTMAVKLIGACLLDPDGQPIGEDAAWELSIEAVNEIGNHLPRLLGLEKEDGGDPVADPLAASDGSATG